MDAIRFRNEDRYRATQVALFAADVFRRLPDEAYVSVFSLFRVLPGPESLLGRAIGWSVVFVVLYEFTPVFTPAALAERDRPQTYRVLFAAISLGFAVAVANVSDLGSLAAPLLLFVSAVAIFLAYFHLLTSWDLLDADGQAVSFLDSYVKYVDVRAEVRQDLSRRGWRYVAGVFLWLVAFGFVFVFLSFVVGSVTAQFGRTFPVADLLLLGTAVFGVISSRGSIGPFDVDERLYVPVGSAMRNLKGTILTLIVIFGFLFSANVASVALDILPDLLGMLVTATWTRPVLAWTVLGMVALLGGSTAYLFWFWLRELARVPRFLDIWEREPSGVSGPTRPPGLTIPPMLAVVAFVPLAAGLDRPATLDRFSVGWPLVLVGLLGCVRWTVRTPPQTPTDEDRVVGLSVVIQAAGIVGVSRTPALEGSHFYVVFADPRLWFLAAAIWLLYVPDLFRLERRATGLAEYAIPAAIAAFGVVSFVLSRLLQGDAAVALSLLAVLCLGGGSLIAVVRYLEYH